MRKLAEFVVMQGPSRTPRESSGQMGVRERIPSGHSAALPRLTA